LFDGESNRFVNGESSLFLVNAREIAYLSAQVKLRELQTKYYKTEAAVKWSAGQIGQ
jgi:outer membrane protein TolC